MKKLRELRSVEEVYPPSLGLEFVPGESPDFLARRNGIVVLGTEVTDFFLDESSARLERMPSYGSSLLSGGDFRHKDDRHVLRVQEVTRLPADGEREQVMAIFREIPPIADGLARLKQSVAEKLNKAIDYLRNCPQVDLIVNDSSGGLMFEQPEEFLRPFFRSEVRRSIIEGQFREVFLLTERRKSGDRICVPLRASAFAADIMLLEKLIMERASKESLDAKAAFAILTVALASSGYGGATMRVNAGEVMYSFASIKYVYTASGKHIVDRTLDAATGTGHDTLGQLSVQLKKEFRGPVDEILADRVKYTSCVDLLYKANADNGGRQIKSA